MVDDDVRILDHAASCSEMIESWVA